MACKFTNSILILVSILTYTQSEYYEYSKSVKTYYANNPPPEAVSTGTPINTTPFPPYTNPPVSQTPNTYAKTPQPYAFTPPPNAVQGTYLPNTASGFAPPPNAFAFPPSAVKGSFAPPPSAVKGSFAPPPNNINRGFVPNMPNDVLPPPNSGLNPPPGVFRPSKSNSNPFSLPNPKQSTHLSETKYKRKMKIPPPFV